MSHLKRHWRSILPIVIVACILVGVFWTINANQPTEPVVVYHLPDRTDDQSDRINTGRLPELLSNKPTTVLIESADIQPPEEVELIEKMVMQALRK